MSWWHGPALAPQSTLATADQSLIPNAFKSLLQDVHECHRKIDQEIDDQAKQDQLIVQLQTRAQDMEKRCELLSHSHRDMEEKMVDMQKRLNTLCNTPTHTVSVVSATGVCEANISKVREYSTSATLPRQHKMSLLQLQDTQESKQDIHQDIKQDGQRSPSPEVVRFQSLDLHEYVNEAYVQVQPNPTQSLVSLTKLHNESKNPKGIQFDTRNVL